MNSLRAKLLAAAAAFTLAPQSPGQEDAELRSKFASLIEELKTLAEKPTREEFIKRKAMSELLVNGSKAYPELKEALLKSDHWAVKASSGFLLYQLYNGTDRETGHRMRQLMDDANPVVRVVTSTLMNNACGGPAKEAMEILSRPEESAIKEKLRVGWLDVAWLSDEDLVRWARANLTIIEEGKLLTDPPTFKSAGNIIFSKDSPMTLGKTSRWDLKPDAYLAKVGLTNALMHTGRGHSLVEPLLKSLETDDGSDSSRLGLKIHLMTSVMSHQDRSCENLQSSRPERCPTLTSSLERLYPVCEKWISTSKDLWVLNWSTWALAYAAGSGFKRATALMEDQAKNHANEEVRKKLDWWLSSLKRRWAEEESEKTRRGK